MRRFHLDQAGRSRRRSVSDAQLSRDARTGRQLAPAMLAIIRERGPVTMNDALRELKAQGRIGPGVTESAGMTACHVLLAEGLVRPLGGKTLQSAGFKWEAFGG